MKKYITQGLSKGFTIGCFKNQSRLNLSITNLRSAFELPEVIDKKLKKELNLGRIIGPFETIPIDDNFIISPLGVIPKKVPGEYRMIQHLSYPYGSSINDYIPSEFASVNYANVQDAVNLIISTDLEAKPVFLAKVDIEAAFRIIPVCPADRPLLGFRWRDQFYMDAVLPMGCSSSCQIFEAFSTALHWIAVNKLGVSGMVHYLDDFLFVAPSMQKCTNDLRVFTEFCLNVGVPLAPDKTLGPANELPFLGITLDAVHMEARLPMDKVDQCKLLLYDFLQRPKVSLKELQSLIGVLSFACYVIIPGRAFLRRLIDLTRGIQRPHHKIRLTTQVKLDLSMWIQFFISFNGRTFFINESFKSGQFLQLYTDASGSIGYGAVYEKQWFFGSWPESWLGYNITVLELYPIVAAVAVWGHMWKNRSVRFYSDNEAVVNIINKQTSKEHHVMTLLRKLVLTCLTYNVKFTAEHVPGVNNNLADKLSRLQVEDFRRLAPWATEQPVELPYESTPVGFGAL